MVRHAIPGVAPLPRTLFTGNPNFQIVGTPGDQEGQLAVLRRALRLLAEASESGVFEEMPRA